MINISSKSEKIELESNISINLKKLLKLANISATELSRRTGVRQPIIHRLIAGENINPTLATIKPIADHFMVTVSQLIGEKEIDSVWSGFTAGQHNGWNKIPLITWDQLDVPAKDWRFTEFALVDSDVGINAYALTIENDCMEPVFPKNCIVIVDPKQLAWELDYVIVQISGNIGTIRQYIIIDDKKYITPINRKSGTICELLAQDNILGVVVRTIYERRTIKRDYD